MALTDFDDLRSKLLTPAQILIHNRIGTNLGPHQRFQSVWDRSPLSSTPTTAPAIAAAVDGTFAQSFTKSNGGAGRQFVASGQLRLSSDSSYANIAGSAVRPFIIVDRLSHQGGLVGNITTLQTNNLPTAALTRYTSAVGVMAMLEMYLAPGATATDITVIYTNSAGTGSRTVILGIPSSEMNAAGACFFIPLLGGDLGIKSVESVQLSASTGGTGNFGVTLFKPLGFGVMNNDGTFDVMNNMMWNEEVLDDAALQVLARLNTSTTFPTVVTSLSLAEC